MSIRAHMRTPFIQTNKIQHKMMKKLGHIVYSYSYNCCAGRQASTVSWKEKHKFTIHFEVNLCIIIWFLSSPLSFILVFDSLNNFFVTAVWPSVFVFVVIGVRRWIAFIIIIIFMLSPTVVSQIYKRRVVLRAISIIHRCTTAIWFSIPISWHQISTFLPTHSFVCLSVRAHSHTQQASSAAQCVLNKFAGRLNNIYHLLEWRKNICSCAPAHGAKMNESVYVFVHERDCSNID